MSKRVLDLQTDELIKRYGKKYAYEWFMRSQDKVHLYLAQTYTDGKCRKITALAATNAVITVLLCFIIWKHLKCR